MKIIKKSYLNNSARLLSNRVAKIDGVGRITSCKKRQLPTGIRDQGISKGIAAHHLLRGGTGVTVAGAELLEVDALQRAVRVANEIEHEEEAGVWSRSLHFGVGFKRPILVFSS